jgi:hypothetical protein
MIETIAESCAFNYVKYHCEMVCSESNSGARLIVPYIGKYVKDYVEKMSGRSYAVWREMWSNFGADSESGQPSAKIIAKADFITLMQYLFDFELITMHDRNDDEHVMRMEFARYDPSETKEKYKGDTVDSSMHACWHLLGGRLFIEKLAGIKRGKGAITL